MRRSLALHGFRNVTYGEGIALSALLDATLFMVQQVWAGKMPLRDLWPSPGAGPSPNMMVEGRGAIEFVAKDTTSGDYVRTEVGDKQRDKSDKHFSSIFLPLFSPFPSPFIFSIYFSPCPPPLPTGVIPRRHGL